MAIRLNNAALEHAKTLVKENHAVRDERDAVE